MIPHSYLLLASRIQTLHFGQHVIFPCPKNHSEIGCHNIKKWDNLFQERERERERERKIKEKVEEYEKWERKRERVDDSREGMNPTN